MKFISFHNNKCETVIYDGKFREIARTEKDKPAKIPAVFGLYRIEYPGIKNPNHFIINTNTLNFIEKNKTLPIATYYPITVEITDEVIEI